MKRNVIKLAIGNITSQAIPIVLTPILARIYDPNEFGILNLYVSIVAIVSVFANLKYENSIVLESINNNKINIIITTFIVNLILSFIFFLVLLLFGREITSQLGVGSIYTWLFTIPIVFFFVGMHNALAVYFNSVTRYTVLSIVPVIRSSSAGLFQLAIPLFTKFSSGLLIGNIISTILSSLFLLRNIEIRTSQYSFRKSILLLSKYKNFPKYSVVSGLFNVGSRNIINILIGLEYGLVILGFYSIVQRLLGMPAQTIGSAISQVYLKRLVDNLKDSQASINIYKKTLLILVLISTPVLATLYYMIVDVFVFVLGEEWRNAGIYAQLLLPLFYIRFISSTLSVTLIAYQKQKQEFIINFIILAASLLVFYISDGFLEFLKLISLILSLLYFIFIFYYYKLCRG